MREADDLAATVRAARQRLASDGPRFTRAAGDFERVALPFADGDVLRDVLVAERATTVIEIGLAYGSSALAIGEAFALNAGEPTHVIVDAYQDQFGNAGLQALAAAGLTARCNVLVERSQLALPRLIGDGFVADAAFVDGSHIFHNIFVDLAFLRELVRPGGLVVLDDCDWPSVATAVRYFERNTGWQRQPIDRPTRLRAYRLPDPRVEPRFEDFEPWLDAD